VSIAFSSNACMLVSVHDPCELIGEVLASRYRIEAPPSVARPRRIAIAALATVAAVGAAALGLLCDGAETPRRPAAELVATPTAVIVPPTITTAAATRSWCLLRRRSRPHLPPRLLRRRPSARDHGHELARSRRRRRSTPRSHRRKSRGSTRTSLARSRRSTTPPPPQTDLWRRYLVRINEVIGSPDRRRDAAARLSELQHDLAAGAK
jgi:hypothetical protein